MHRTEHKNGRQTVSHEYIFIFLRFSVQRRACHSGQSSCSDNKLQTQNVWDTTGLCVPSGLGIYISLSHVEPQTGKCPSATGLVSTQSEHSDTSPTAGWFTTALEPWGPVEITESHRPTPICVSREGRRRLNGRLINRKKWNSKPWEALKVNFNLVPAAMR